MLRTIRRGIGLVAVLYVCCLEAVAQQNPPTVCEDGTVLADEDDACPVPLDGGVLFLLAAGAAYGAKKIRDNKQDSAEIS
ncbi:MAG: hypothetical protein K0S09_2586 [Sphingobacteriaceae bacterium]|jgi:hypothetical protein|nr:hypothetical protein [Sphingobacteriaceae bacterium]